MTHLLRNFSIKIFLEQVPSIPIFNPYLLYEATFFYNKQAYKCTSTSIYVCILKI